MRIGNIEYNNEEIIITRDCTDQGYVFKDYDAYENDPDAPCYVPELNDYVYTKNDFLKICNYQEEIANFIFETVDWQSPETLLYELFNTQELAYCSTCGKIIFLFEKTECPYCKAKI